MEGRVAGAVAEAHPDRAAAFYREVVAGRIARASPSASGGALPTPRKLREPLHRLGRDAEWQGRLAHPREAQRRKRRLLEELDRLEGRPIGDE